MSNDQKIINRIDYDVKALVMPDNQCVILICDECKLYSKMCHFDVFSTDAGYKFVKVYAECVVCEKNRICIVHVGKKRD